MRIALLLPLLIASNVFASTGDIGSGGTPSSICGGANRPLLLSEYKVSEAYACEGLQSSLCLVKASGEYREYFAFRGKIQGDSINALVYADDDSEGTVKEKNGVLYIQYTPDPTIIVDAYKRRETLVVDKNTGSAGFRYENKEVLSFEPWEVMYTEKMSCKKIQ